MAQEARGWNRTGRVEINVLVISNQDYNGYRWFYTYPIGPECYY